MLDDALAVLSDSPPDPARVREALAQVLHDLHERTRDPRFAVAAGVLRGRRGGRPAIDDTAALDQVRDLATDGMTVQRAAEAIAATLHGESADVDSTVRRLMRKHARGK